VPGKTRLGDELVVVDHPAEDESAEQIDRDIGAVKQVFSETAQQC